MQVWVAYATPIEQFLIALEFRAGMTIFEAIQESGLAQKTQLPEPLHVGIFGIKVDDLNQGLHAGDRIEIYRALTINPKDIRRNRAAKNPIRSLTKGNRFKQSQ